MDQGYDTEVDADLRAGIAKILGLEAAAVPEKGACPLCNDRRKDCFGVSDAKGFNCFACGAKGRTKISFAIAFCNGDWKAAIKLLADLGFERPAADDIKSLLQETRRLPSAAKERKEASKLREKISKQRLPAFPTTGGWMEEEEAIALATRKERPVYFIALRGEQHANERFHAKAPAPGIDRDKSATIDPEVIRGWLKKGYRLGINLRLSQAVAIDFDKGNFPPHYQPQANSRDALAGISQVQRALDHQEHIALIGFTIKAAGAANVALSLNDGYHCFFQATCEMESIKVAQHVGLFEYPTDWVEAIAGGVLQADGSLAKPGYVAAYTRQEINPKKLPALIPPEIFKCFAAPHRTAVKSPYAERLKNIESTPTAHTQLRYNSFVKPPKG